MKRSIFGPVQAFGGLLFVMLMTLVGCSAPTDHVGEWTVIEKDGKALGEGLSTQYFFGADNIAAKNEIAEKNGALNLYAYEVERNGNELSLVGIENESETYQIEMLKDANGKEQMKLTGANGTFLLEKTGEAQSAINDTKYRYLYYPVTVIDDESGMRMTLRLFCNGHMMLDSYQMNYEFDASKGVIAIKNQGNTVFQITIISDKEWEFGVEGAGSARREVITTKR